MPMDTKQYIADHLNALLKRMQLEDITVKALVEDCQISRQTFYYHFQDLVDVIQWSIHQALDRSLQKSLQAGSLEEAIGIFVSGAAQNRALLKRLLDSPRRAQMEHLLIQALQAYLTGLFECQLDDSRLTAADLRSLLCFCSYGITGLLLEECRPDPESQKRLTRQICRLLSGQMQAEGRPQS